MVLDWLEEYFAGLNQEIPFDSDVEFLPNHWLK